MTQMGSSGHRRGPSVPRRLSLQAVDAPSVLLSGRISPGSFPTRKGPKRTWVFLLSRAREVGTCKCHRLYWGLRLAVLLAGTGGKSARTPL